MSQLDPHNRLRVVQFYRQNSLPTYEEAVANVHHSVYTTTRFEIAESSNGNDREAAYHYTQATIAQVSDASTRRQNVEISIQDQPSSSMGRLTQTISEESERAVRKQTRRSVEACLAVLVIIIFLLVIFIGISTGRGECRLSAIKQSLSSKQYCASILCEMSRNNAVSRQVYKEYSLPTYEEAVGVVQQPICIIEHLYNHSEAPDTNIHVVSTQAFNVFSRAQRVEEYGRQNQRAISQGDLMSIIKHQIKHRPTRFFFTVFLMILLFLMILVTIHFRTR